MDTASRMPRRSSRQAPWLGTGILAAMMLLLPLMMGQRTPDTLTASLLLLTWGSVAAFVTLFLTGRVGLPTGGWLTVAGLMSGMVALQVLPLPWLTVLGPYPPEIMQHPEIRPISWSPDPGASLRGWAAFMALFLVAWCASQLPARQRHFLWLALLLAVLFQALYGLLSHAAGSSHIFGIWERNNPAFVHGSFSNRNLYAAYLALLWPLAAGIWFFHSQPGLGRWPLELRIAASVICGAIIGAALLASASRLGAAAGVLSMLLAIAFWARHRWLKDGSASLWPMAAAGLAALLFATWYGLTPLAERLVATSAEEARLELFALALAEFPRAWWLHGVGLGGFEAAFRPYQPGHMTAWFDYAHNDLLQWWVETGLVGMAVLIFVAWQLLRRFRSSTENIALLAGLLALCVVAMGDFSWHLPATQIVQALFIGTLLRKPTPPKSASGSAPGHETAKDK